MSIKFKQKSENHDEKILREQFILQAVKAFSKNFPFLFIFVHFSFFSVFFEKPLCLYPLEYALKELFLLHLNCYECYLILCNNESTPRVFFC